MDSMQNYQSPTSSFHEKMLEQCDIVSKNSRDANTKVGCVITRNGQILETGYNDLINNVVETPEKVTRPLKTVWIEHAERNAIYKAARKGLSLENSTIYLNWWPCVDCCRAIIQSGIIEIVSNNPPDLNDERWGEQFKHTLDLVKESGIKTTFVKKIK
jgi:dCMP deaminase